MLAVGRRPSSNSFRFESAVSPRGAHLLLLSTRVVSAVSYMTVKGNDYSHDPRESDAPDPERATLQASAPLSAVSSFRLILACMKVFGLHKISNPSKVVILQRS